MKDKIISYNNAKLEVSTYITQNMCCLQMQVTDGNNTNMFTLDAALVADLLEDFYTSINPKKQLSPVDTRRVKEFTAMIHARPMLLKQMIKEKSDARKS